MGLNLNNMNFKRIRINLSEIDSIEEMHEELITKFGFPNFYGKNVYALIDCWSSLRFPNDEMSEFVLKDDEVLILEIKGLVRANDVVLNNLIIAIENVNRREIDRGKQASIYLCPIL